MSFRCHHWHSDSVIVEHRFKISIVLCKESCKGDELVSNQEV